MLKNIDHGVVSATQVEVLVTEAMHREATKIVIRPDGGGWRVVTKEHVEDPEPEVSKDESEAGEAATEG